MTGQSETRGARQYRLISADSHVLEPPDLWQSRVPARYRSRAPRLEHFPEGDAWVLEGVADPINFGLNASAGMDPSALKPWIRWEDLRPGAFDATAPLTPPRGWPSRTATSSTPRSSTRRPGSRGAMPPTRTRASTSPW